MRFARAGWIAAGAAACLAAVLAVQSLPPRLPPSTDSSDEALVRMAPRDDGGALAAVRRLALIWASSARTSEALGEEAMVEDEAFASYDPLGDTQAISASTTDEIDLAVPSWMVEALSASRDAPTIDEHEES